MFSNMEFELDLRYSLSKDIIFRECILNLLRSPEPVFVKVQLAQKSIPPAYVAWRAGTTNRVVVPARHPPG
jgi:hypothetical protein